MSQPVVSRSRNWKFSYAAAAMGAFWARARKIEASRIEKIRQTLFDGKAMVAGATLRRSW